MGYCLVINNLPLLVVKFTVALPPPMIALNLFPPSDDISSVRVFIGISELNVPYPYHATTLHDDSSGIASLTVPFEVLNAYSPPGRNFPLNTRVPLTEFASI